jgi:hypothetical protein
MRCSAPASWNVKEIERERDVIHVYWSKIRRRKKKTILRHNTCLLKSKMLKHKEINPKLIFVTLPFL